MKLIFISDNGSYHKRFNLEWKSCTLLLLSLALIFSSIFYIVNYSKQDSISSSEIMLLKKFDSMLLKAAKLEGQVKRLNSLGEVIAKKNNLDIRDYLLARKPAMGGFDESRANNVSFTSAIITQDNLVKSIDDLELELELQEQRYEILNRPLLNTKKAKSPSIKTSFNSFADYSTPVKTGYVSSAFGKRRDPINGHQRHHNGIDIAAKHGSKIQAIASGFVTFAGRKGGYGNVIDIHHSDSLKSRYAHLHKIKVKKGDVVRKADIIATMGKTGRATGSHLHLEVWEKNHPVNPEAYIDTALIK